MASVSFHQGSRLLCLLRPTQSPLSALYSYGVSLRIFASIEASKVMWASGSSNHELEGSSAYASAGFGGRNNFKKYQEGNENCVNKIGQGGTKVPCSVILLVKWRVYYLPCRRRCPYQATLAICRRANHAIAMNILPRLFLPFHLFFISSHCL